MSSYINGVSPTDCHFMSAPGMKSGLEDKVEFEKRSGKSSDIERDTYETQSDKDLPISFIGTRLCGTISGVPKLDQFHHPSKSSMDHNADFSPQPI